MSEWPSEERIDVIGSNGNDGAHYDAVDQFALFHEAVERAAAKWARGGMDAVPSKYHREIKPGVWIDVYDVLKAFDVRNPALQHLLKKALAPGKRGHKDLMTDLDDIIASAQRAKELGQ